MHFKEGRAVQDWRDVTDGPLQLRRHVDTDVKSRGEHEETKETVRFIALPKSADECLQKADSLTWRYKNVPLIVPLLGFEASLK
jgi:hypothetical protein